MLLVAGVSPARAAPAHGPAIQPAADRCPGNLLVNPGFEEGFIVRQRPEEVVPIGWTPWFATFPGVDGLNYPIEYRPRFAPGGPTATASNGRLVHGGLWSVELLTSGATHTGGLWQRVGVPPGMRLLATAWARAWATDGTRPELSQPTSTYGMSLGVDPWGGEDPESQRIRWTEPITVTDNWVPLGIDLTAMAPVVTVFTKGQAQRILRINSSRWDGMCLRVLGPPDQPTATPTWSAPPTWTPATPDTPVPSPTPDRLLAAAEGTELALSVIADATRRAAERAVDAQPMATIRAAATRIAARGTVGASTAGGRGVPFEPERNITTWERARAAAVERSGLLMLALAAMVAGALYGRTVE